VRGAHVVCCATNSKKPVLHGEWLEPGQMVITIANSDVLNTRREVDETTFARASAIIINDWESVTANRPRSGRDRLLQEQYRACDAVCGLRRHHSSQACR
jgi:ornithine cyclodeaminase/alanine dehydrogenase-like protein (mu-crystallin family)